MYFFHCYQESKDVFNRNQFNLSFIDTWGASTERQKHCEEGGAGLGLTKQGSDHPDNQHKTWLTHRTIF